MKRVSRFVLVAGLFFAEQPCGSASAFLTFHRKEVQHQGKSNFSSSITEKHCQNDSTSLLPLRNYKSGVHSDTTTRLCLASTRKRPKGKPTPAALANVTIIGIDDDENNGRSTTDRQQRRKRAIPEDFEKRKEEWEAKYGSLQALCRTFGGCNNRLYGDLSGEQARLLYHTLLPRSIVALQEAGILEAEELAPLAYQARLAAKEYARMRSTLPNRLLAMAFDSYRSWRREGNPLKTKGLTWEDLWDKYEAQIVEEECESEIKQGKKCLLDRDALMQRIYLRILEKSCATNQAFDKMFLNEKKATIPVSTSSVTDMGELASIASQLETDVREILLPPEDRKKLAKIDVKIEKADTKARQKAEAKQISAAKNENKLLRKELKHEIKQAMKDLKFMKAGSAASETDRPRNEDNDAAEGVVDKDTKQAQYRVLRIAANARRKLRVL
jgi:hypothetical protein